MTEERTVQKTDKVIEKGDIRKLDEYNPVGDVRTELRETEMKITDMKIPPIKYILNGRKPSIKLIGEIGDDTVETDIVLDRFSENVEPDDITFSDLLNTYDIPRDNIGSLLKERIPIKINRFNGSYNVHLSNHKEIEINSVNSISKYSIKPLQKLWKAQKYGKIRIIGLEKVERDIVTVKTEIPWLSEEYTLRFSIENRDSVHPPFVPFFKHIVGRPPVNNQDLNAILDEEINVSYKGQLSLSDEVIRRIQSENRTFKSYLKQNTSSFKSLYYKNLAFTTAVLLTPPMFILPAYLFLMLGSLLTPLFGILLVVFSFHAISGGISIFKARRKYKKNEPISDK